MRPHKYGAKACVIDGIRFPSQAEGRRYAELKLLEKAGEIASLQRQPKFALYVRTPIEMVQLGDYYADFEYWDTRSNCRVVEDVKGWDVPLQKWKRQHAEAQYGITVQLIRDGRPMTRSKPGRVRKAS